MAAFNHSEETAEWGRVQDFEENWLADSDEDGAAADHLNRDARRHSHDEADTDQQSLSQLADHDHDRVHESEGRATARTMFQSGYRDGAAKGSEAAFQQRFDAGFARGMAVGRLVGELWQQVQLALKQLPQGGEAPSVAPATATATATLTRSADATFAAERQLLQRDADACLQLLLHELPEVLAAVSSPAAMADATTDGGDAIAGAAVAAALAAAVPSDELDADARAVAAFDLRRVQDERREVRAVLARLRATLRRFPAPTLLVCDALVALFAD